MRKRVLCHMRTTKAQITCASAQSDQRLFVRCLDSVMSLVSVTKISNFMLASVAEQAGLSLTWSETPEDTFSHDEAQLMKMNRTVTYNIQQNLQNDIYAQRRLKSVLASSQSAELNGWPRTRSPSRQTAKNIDQTQLTQRVICMEGRKGHNSVLLF